VQQRPEPILAAAGADDAKAMLRAQTERAVNLGIFGAPSFVAQGELFWGNDRLEQALQWGHAHAEAAAPGAGAASTHDRR
jgi:2-hydroxychromene-2-carboxylate isomerase